MDNKSDEKYNLQTDRQTHYDLLRILLVVLVVIGHGTYYNITTLFGGIEYGTLMNIANVEDANFHKLMSIISNFIYTFHMPVFIALSGSIYAINNTDNFKTLAIKKSKRLLIPFLVIWFLWNFPIKYFTGYYENVSIAGIMLQLIFPSGVYLWYLECLFLVFLLAFLLVKMDERKQYLVVVFCWGIGVILYKNLSQYHFLGDPLYYLAWFYMGYKIEEIIKLLKKMKFWKTSKILCLLVFYIVLFVFNTFFSLRIIRAICTFIVYPLLMFIILNFAVRNIQVNSKYIERINGYCMGCYLYAEPLNYLFIYIFYNIFGISYFGSELGAMTIYFSRILITPLMAIGITWILKKMDIKYLY